MSDSGVHYASDYIRFLERLWGDGYLSPGGREEVERLLKGMDLKGRTVVDLGCGSGGITVALARDFNAGHVIGIDVEEPVCNSARQRVEDAALSGRIEIRQVHPGPLSFDDDSLDIVFSKDAIVHIPDKESLARDVFRVLKPGGWFVASDWLISHDDEPSDVMQKYLVLEDLDFGMASPGRYQKALADAGFVNIEWHNRNAWYRQVSRQELARLEGPDRPEYEAIIGAEALQEQIEVWRAMIPAVESGEHCPHHFRAQKPH